MAKDRGEAKPIVRCPKTALFLESESVSPHGRGTWYARVPADHTIEDVLSSNYFGHFAHDTQGKGGIRTGDLIDIEPESALWRIQVRVMALLPALQQIKVREAQNMRQSYAERAPQGYEFVWLGGSARWVIMRGEVMVDGGYVSQSECLARCEELNRERAA